MRSFDVAIEPAAAPRLAATAALVHAFAVAAPWLARVPTALAITLTALALAGFAATLARLPGRHASLAALSADGRQWRLRRWGARAWEPGTLGSGSRAYPALVYVEVRTSAGRLGWLLPRGSVPEADFRRLKARIRLSC
jgi:hypothetical protein